MANDGDAASPFLPSINNTKIEIAYTYLDTALMSLIVRFIRTKSYKSVNFYKPIPELYIR